MKINLFVTNDAIQFNLEPESEHEKEFFAILTKYTGEVTISRGVDIGLCQGGYIRSFGENSRVTTVTIRKPKMESG